MNPKLKRFFLLATVGIMTHVLAFAAGYYLSSARARAEVGQRALNTLMDELSALAYLDKGEVDRSRNMLVISLDSHLLDLDRFGTAEFDEHMPGSRNKWILQYQKIREKYPLPDYSDGGAMNAEVSRVFNAARNSRSGKQ
jgi:hypothetical protein